MIDGGLSIFDSDFNSSISIPTIWVMPSSPAAAPTSQDLDARHLDAVLRAVRVRSNGDFWSMQRMLEGWFTLPDTDSSHLNIDGWKTSSFWRKAFWDVSFRECKWF